jgi:hypothetical protein
LKKKYGYAPTDALDSRQISAYLFDHQKMTPLKFIPDEGIIAETFDNVIRSLNQSSHDIYYTIQEELEEQESDMKVQRMTRINGFTNERFCSVENDITHKIA